MKEFMKTGLAHVIHEKSAFAFNNCVMKAPSAEEQEADAKSMAKQFGIEDWTEYRPLYPEDAKDFFGLINEAQDKHHLLMKTEKFAFFTVENPENNTYHIASFFKPLVIERIKNSPHAFGLPDNPSNQEITEKLEYLCNPKNYLDWENNQDIYSYLLFDDAHSIKRFIETEGIDLKEREKLLAPINEELAKMVDDLPEEKKDHTVVPKMMLYFKSGGEKTEQLARENIQNTHNINHNLEEKAEKMKASNPGVDFADVVFNDVISRLYYPSLNR